MNHLDSDYFVTCSKTGDQFAGKHILADFWDVERMGDLNFIKEESRRYKIAKETLEVFAPLAGRVGFQIMREELEELAFKVTNKQAFQSINKRIQFLRKQNSDFISRNILNLDEVVCKAIATLEFIESIY